MHELGHTIIRFIPPATKTAFILMSKLQSNEKSNRKCLKASWYEQFTSLSSLQTWYHLLKLPIFVKKYLGNFIARGMNDHVLADVANNVGGENNGRSKSMEGLQRLLDEKEEYCKIFDSHWKQPHMDVLLCPVHAFPPMPTRSNGFTWVGSFYSSLFNLLDYPVGVVPRIVNVLVGETVPNPIQFAHSEGYVAKTSRYFNFLAVMGYEEVNARIANGDIVGQSIGVQVVGRPYEEEKVLAVMKILSDHFAL
jgi:amidase